MESSVLRECPPDRLLQLLQELVEIDHVFVDARTLAGTRDYQFYSREFGVQSRAHKAPPVLSYASLPRRAHEGMRLLHTSDWHLEAISFGESAIADEGAGDAGEGEEVVGFPFV
ncbi:hypothetical protein ACWCXE_31875, partial [Streptomyces sp. NPDC001780]